MPYTCFSYITLYDVILNNDDCNSNKNTVCDMICYLNEFLKRYFYLVIVFI